MKFIVWFSLTSGVILRTDHPMALCQTLSPAPKKGKDRQHETMPGHALGTLINCAAQIIMGSNYLGHGDMNLINI